MPIYRIIALATLLLAAGCGPALAQVKGANMEPLVRAPEFPKGFAWLNSDKPLRFSQELKGQVVVLDFWTYCCINCMHILPDLAYLEHKYQDQPVAIIGIHSAKYDNEADTANIRAAIQRYGITHPVIVDEKHAIWSAFDVSAWPTLIVISPDGRIIGGTSGEGHRDLLDKVIAQALADGKSRGILAAAPLKLPHEGQVHAAWGGLSFPAKVVPDPPAAGRTGRLFIVDSNHNRIVTTSWPDESGRTKLQTVIGSGDPGATDGDFAHAQFNRPQGAALASGGNVLWVADTENHLVRRVDLEKKVVVTALGTGKQDFDPEAGKSGRAQGLNSPWDVAVLGNRLFIAQAGQHQIFAMNLMTGMTEVAAGSARENIRDGEAWAANLAQPSGLAIDAQRQVLYFADSEVSAVRGLDLVKKQVFTVIGHGLFDFGDIDGAAEQARLQHPLGVCVLPDGKLLVADTYNHKLKELDPVKRTARTIAGTGKEGTGMPGRPVQFFEPAGVAAAGAQDVFVADTNNQRIVRLNLATGAWKELMIDGLTAPEAAEDLTDKEARDGGRVEVSAGSAVKLAVQLEVPPDAHLTDGAPVSVQVTDGQRVLYRGSLMRAESQVVGELPAEALAGRPAQLWVMVYYTTCKEGPAAVCVPAKASWRLAMRYGGEAAELRLVGP